MSFNFYYDLYITVTLPFNDHWPHHPHDLAECILNFITIYKLVTLAFIDHWPHHPRDLAECLLTFITIYKLQLPWHLTIIGHIIHMT